MKHLVHYQQLENTSIINKIKAIKLRKSLFYLNETLCLLTWMVF